MKTKLALRYIIGIMLPLSIHAAPDLLDVYQQSLRADPKLKEAYNKYQSTHQNVPISTAQLLPQIIGTGSFNRNDTIIKNTASALFGGEDIYNQWNYTVSLTQPIFNYQLWMQNKQASFASRQAQAIFNAAQQDLMFRSAKAYFAILAAKDALRFSKAKERANQRQYDQANQRYKVGLESVTPVYEAQAALDASHAQVIAEKNNVTNQFEKLRELTNKTYTSIALLNGQHIPLIVPKPQRVSSWVSTALNQNYELIAADYANKAARANIKAKNAGHLPTLNLQSSYSKTSADGNFPSFASTTTNKQLGVALNFPIFQSGLVESQVKQSVYDFRATRDRFEQTYRRVMVDTTIAYNSIIDGISKIKADRQAVKSAQNAALSTEAQFQAGTRTMVDVVTAQEQLFEAQTMLANDRYNYILSLLRIKQLAGTLSTNDLVKINHWLNSSRRHTR